MASHTNASSQSIVASICTASAQPTKASVAFRTKFLHLHAGIGLLQATSTQPSDHGDLPNESQFNFQEKRTETTKLSKVDQIFPLAKT